MNYTYTNIFFVSIELFVDLWLFYFFSLFLFFSIPIYTFFHSQDSFRPYVFLIPPFHLSLFLLPYLLSPPKLRNSVIFSFFFSCQSDFFLILISLYFWLRNFFLIIYILKLKFFLFISYLFLFLLYGKVYFFRMVKFITKLTTVGILKCFSLADYNSSLSENID